MTMARRNKLRNGRHQAVFGADGAAMAVATLAAAAINAGATASAAKTQAAAVEASAKSRADALVKQNENNTNLQEKNIAFTKEENERNRDLQKEIQRNLQLLTGKQNFNEMREAAKIQVKNGGSMRRKLRNTSPYFLRGRNGNLPFTVTDGGGVIPIATTPEGYDLYEIVGNDHEHYHKAQGGKSKTGVGIRFAGKKTIEGEGNQNTNQGELMLVTPTDAKFISKHSIKGFNPAKAVLAGVHPIDAFNTQEAIKDANGISDDGKSGNNSPVRRMRSYGGLNTLNITPNLSLDFLAPVATGIVAGTRNENQARNGRSLKCGGRCKKPGGGGYSTYYDIYEVPYDETYVPTAPTGVVTPTVSGGTNYAAGANPNVTQNGNLTGAWLGAAGNLGGAIISGIGNTIAGSALANAYNRAGDIIADAYGRIHGIDMSSINRRDFAAAHAMAALQAPIINTGAERSAAERTLHRNLARINRNTLSSAAAQNRSARAEVDYNDRISQIETNADKLRQDIIQNNMNRITQIANENANRDTKANQQYAKFYLDLLQYNNDIENEKIRGAAQARADALTQSSSAIANARQASYAGLAGAISQSGLGFANTLATNAKMANELDMTLLGASMENQVMYYLDHPNAPGKQRLLKMLKNSSDPKYKEWYNALNG